MADTQLIPIPGSERTPLPGARVVGSVDPAERIEVTVIVRPRAVDGSLSNATAGASVWGAAQYLSRAELAATRGADGADLDRVARFAQAHNMAVLETSAARRTVRLAGSAAAVSAAFGVSLDWYEHDGGRYRGRTGAVHVPTEIAPVVQAVLGLDARPQARAHFRIAGGTADVAARPLLAAAAQTFTPPQVAQLYGFPQGDGKGQCVALIELGGGYRQADLTTYFARLGIAAPQVLSVSVDGGQNRPSGDPSSADGEVLLDIDVAGAIAPAARLVVYFAPNTDSGFLDAITTAIHDTINNPTVVSISWGSAEPAWTAQSLRAYDQAFADAAAIGVTICCASGDNGSGDGVNDGHPHVDFPASSPHVLGCGGTRLSANNGAIADEVVWNQGNGAGGGGVSAVFALPAWQGAAGVPAPPTAGGGRGVPDVAGDADPATGYAVQVDGQQMVFGGTSAVAPLWAALIARMNGLLGRPVGFLNPLLYGQGGPAALRDVVTGSNGAYRAGPGWDPCTGLGSPNGEALLTLLRGGRRPA